MKKVALLFLGIFMALGTDAFGQTSVINPKPIKPRPKRQDQVILDIHSSQMLRQQGQEIRNKWYSFGFTGHLMWDFTIKRSNFSFGLGAGASNENYFINRKVTYDPAINGTVFTAFPDTFKRYKFSTTTLEIPLELRFRLHPHRRNTFKMALGARVGYLISTKTKYVGDGLQYGNSIKNAKIKEYNVPGVNRFVYGLHLRMGYGRFAGTVYYGLSEVFQKNKGPKGWHPITIGFTLTPF